MPKISKQTAGCTQGAWRWFSRIAVLAKLLGGVLFLAMLLHPVPARSATLPGAYNVTLLWDGMSNSQVTGFRVYYGTESQNYSSSMVVGNATTVTVPGLSVGVTYFFAVTAYDASGLESDFSVEVSYVRRLPNVRTSVTPAGQIVLTVQGQAGHTYNIEATEDLVSWTVIGTVLLGAGAAQEFTDPNAASFKKRFYRIHDLQP